MEPLKNKKMRYPLEIEVDDYLFGHHFEGRCVLPAVEALIILAKAVQTHFPNMDMGCLNKARFPRFLIIPPEMRHLPVIIELDRTPNGGISALLMTSVRSKTGGIGRNLEHARVEFFLDLSTPFSSPPLTEIEDPEGPAITVTAGSIYPVLIPFGKAFHNIISPVSLWPGEASAHISGGEEGPEDTLLGSPFPLDAAFHVACIWGQRFTEQVLFPMGFENRIIHQRTKKGGVYHGRIFPGGSRQNVFMFNALIIDEQGTVCEEIRGIQMQDVSQGRLHPPLWIKELGPA
ncbi:MAG: polyketide synthase dehydratase domain-containing protein [Candidatus Aquicultor sp.]